MYYSIIDPKLNSKFQLELQLRDEVLIIHDYYYDIKELEKVFNNILGDILDIDSNQYYDDPLVDIHRNSIISNNADYENSYYFQLCEFLNYDKYCKTIQKFKEMLGNLEIWEIRDKISQINSAIAFMDYCLLAKSLEKKGFVDAVWGWDNDCEIRLNKMGLCILKKVKSFSF